MSATAELCPYKGLQPYTEEDRAYFFGRERDQEIIAANLYASPLTVLYGASGAGKSSVLLAGVVPQLRQARRLAIVVFRDWQNPDFQAALKRALRQEVERSLGKPCEIDTALPFDDFLAACARKLRGPVFFVLDQFEEYFLYHPAAEGEEGFDAAFARAVNREEIGASFLLSIREDGLSKLDRFQGRIPHLLANLLRLDYLDREAATRAIRRPLDEYNRRLAAGGMPVAIQDELVEVLLRDLQTGKVTLSPAGQGQADASAGTRIETPLLQLVLTRLWQEETAAGSRVLRLATLQNLGGTENIARTHLDTAMAGLSEPEREVAARLFRFLVTPSGSKIAQDLPSLVAWSEVDEATARSVLARLTSGSRILRPVTAAGQADRYEIFHDVLAPAILDWRRRYVQVQELREAERQAEEQKQRAEAQARAASRLRWLAGALAVVTLLVLGVAVWAVRAQRAAIEAQISADVSGSNAEGNAWAARRAEREARAAEREAEVALGVADKAKATAVEEKANAEKQARIAQARELAAEADKHWKAEDLREKELGTLLALAAVEVTRSADGTVTREARDVLQQAVGGVRIQLSQSGHRAEVIDVAYSPDGRRIVTGSRDGTLKVWEAGSGKLVKTLPWPGFPEARGIRFSADGKRIAVGKDLGVSVRDLATGDERLRGRGYRGSVVERFALSPDGESLATVTRDQTVRLWRSPDGTEPWVFPDEPGVHETFKADVAFSADGRQAIIVRPTRIQVIDATSGAVLRTTPLQAPRGGLSALSPDGRRYATALDGQIQIWDVTTGTEVRAFRDEAAREDRLTALALSGDGSRLVTVGGKHLAVWDTASGRRDLERAIEKVGPISFRPDGGGLVFSAGDTSFGTMADDGSVTPSWGVEETHLRGVVFSADGRRIAATSDKGQLRVWDTASGREDLTIPFGELSLAFSRDGKRLAVVSDRENTVALYDAVSGEPLRRLTGTRQAYLFRAVFSPDGSWLATVGYDHTGVFWDLAAARERFRLSDEGSFHLAFSSDGQRLATTGRNSAVWDIASRKRILKLNLRGNQASFSPDGRQLAVAGETTTVVETGSGKLLYTVSGGLRDDLWAQGAGGVAFSPDGRLLATVAEDARTVKIWDAQTGAEQATLYGHEKAVRGIAFSADGFRLLTLSEDWTLHAHPLRIEDLVALARTRVQRELRADERRKYLHQP